MEQRIVGMYEAKTTFSQLIGRVVAGEEVVISRSGRPVAKIVGFTPLSAPRKPGLLAGRIVVKPGFDEPPPPFEEAFRDDA